MESLSAEVFERLLASDTGSSPTIQEIVERASLAGVAVAKHDLEAAALAHRLKFDELTQQQCRLLLALQVGDQQVKAREAFALLDDDKDGWVELASLERLIKLFEVSEQTASEIGLEIAQDGSEKIQLERLLAYLPNDFSHHPKAYSGQHRGVPPRQFNHPEATKSSLKLDKQSIQGTSPLQMQIGLFRLLQGAAYRSFRESYSANSETHLRAYDLPYTIPNFVRFVNTALDLFLSLGIVQVGAEEPFETLRASVNKAELDLRERMANWDTIPHTPAMEEAEGVLEQELNALDHHHQILSVVLNILLTAVLHGHDPYQVDHEDLQLHELNRLRQLDDHHEIMADLDHAKSEKSRPYHDTWQRVIVDSVDSRFAGSIMPTAYWYDEFMPLLLRACSVLSPADIKAWDEASDQELNTWFSERQAAGEFENYGHATKDSFESRPLSVKKELRRAWELSRHYLNGVQKRREREEFGRESGFLCQYVPFLDIHVGRNDVEMSQMRVSFPYFIGPPTWRLMHTSAELIADQTGQQQVDSVAAFKEFFGSLATMYPCPYCRFHLNRYVVRNREIDMYPIEYLLLGSDEVTSSLEISLEDKLEIVTDGESLRLFLWKLHNTVSSSIARSEDWYHQDQTAYYTSRYWPSLDSELERAHALGVELIQRDRVQRIYGVVKSAAHLSILRDELRQSLHADDLVMQRSIRERAGVAIEGVEKAVMDSRFLHDHYRYDIDLTADTPHFSHEEEALARSGFFTED